jgi:hypothetical protein
VAGIEGFSDLPGTIDDLAERLERFAGQGLHRQPI